VKKLCYGESMVPLGKGTLGNREFGKNKNSPRCGRDLFQGGFFITGGVPFLFNFFGVYPKTWCWPLNGPEACGGAIVSGRSTGGR